MSTRMVRRASLPSLFALCLSMLVPGVLADSVPLASDALGAPSIPIATGTDIVGNGVGMINVGGNPPPYTISFVVPAGATINQVLVYWNGFHSTVGNGDDTATLDAGGGAVAVMGTLIGGPRLFFGAGATSNYSSTYRADITGLGLVTTGPNVIEVSGLSFDQTDQANGATILAIIDDPASFDKKILLVDGQDLAFINFAPPLQGTVAQTLSFTASDFDRLASLTLLAGSVQGPTSGADPVRPNRVVITNDGSDPSLVDCLTPGPNVDVDGTCDDPTAFACCLIDPFASINGPEWDHVVESIVIPTGSTSLTIQAFSAPDGSGNLPASFVWMASALGVPDFCELEVDKQVSCDGGVTWVDVTPDAGIESCVGIVGQSDIKVRYLAETASSASTMYDCVLTDSNGMILGAPVAIGNLPGNQPFTIIHETALLECNDALEAGEPDTATLTCECFSQGSGDTRQSQDTAAFDCQVAAVDLEKVCDPIDGNGNNAIHILVTNPANPNGAALENCVVTDPLAAFMSAPFNLAPGQFMQFDTSVNGLVTPTLNQAFVTCDVVGTDDTVEDMDEDLCEVECDVLVEKEVSCDGGATWSDDCEAVNLAGPEVQVRYVATSGTADLFNCILTDSNGAILGAPVPVGDIPNGTTGQIVHTTGLLECDDNLEAGEPNTAILTCECFSDGSGVFEDDDDTANIECVVPGLMIEKVCDAIDAQGQNDIHIVVTNTGETVLEDCVVTDPVAGFTSAPFDLAPAEVENIEIFVAGLVDDTLNVASVECNVAGTGTSVEAVTDGGFEDGIPNQFWFESSTNFGTPLCDSSCGLDPTEGDIYAWFGGTSAFEEGIVRQAVTLPAGISATLSFTMRTGCNGPAGDFFRVNAGATTVFSFNMQAPNAPAGPCDTGLDVANAIEQTVDLTPFLGQAFNLEFFARTGTAGTNSSIVIDEVSIQVLQAPPATLSDSDEDLCEVECDVDVEKEVSCDGGATWSDSCSTLDGNDVQVRYVASSGDAALFNCVLTDSNGLILGGPVDAGDLPANTTGQIVHTTGLLECNDDLEAGEPDTATLVCECFFDGSGSNQQDQDTANIECLAPDVAIEKVCDAINAQGQNDIHITVTNTGDTALEDCVVTDPVAGFTSDPFDLAPAEVENIEIFVAGLVDDTLNVASVECNVAGTGTSVEAVTDGGFEDGIPNQFWFESSTNFGTPLCDSSCGLDATDGAFYAWFGGTSAFEEGILRQAVTLPAGTSATLSFTLRTGCNGVAGDFFRVNAGATTVFSFNMLAPNAPAGPCDTGLDVANAVVQTVDLTPFLGQAFNLEFFARTGTNGTNSSIVIDEVSIQVVQEAPDTVSDTDDDLCEVDCDVDVEKEVSCDGGATWSDACTGLEGANEVKVRYIAGSGEANLFNCVLTDSNGVILGGPVATGDLPANTTGVNIFETGLLTCNDGLEAGEPNTATLVCECFFDGSGSEVQDEDTADIECLFPDVTIEKVCDSINAQGQNDIHITVTNTGETVLEDCVVTDPVAGFTSAPFDLAPAEVENIEIFVAGLVGDTLNVASVECNVAGTGTSVEAVTDGGFEDGIPNQFWFESSTNFGTPLCDSSCGLDPTDGAFYAWFGGTSAFEEGILRQAVTLPAGISATLSFTLRTSCNGPAGDFFRVNAGATTVFSFNMQAPNAPAGPCDTGLDVANAVVRTVDLTPFLGQAFNLEFFARTGTAGTNSSIVIDEVSIQVLQQAPDTVSATDDDLCEACPMVDLVKEVSCDGGMTYSDFCIGFDPGTPVQVRYTANSTGPLFDCVLTDSNGQVLPVPVAVGDINGNFVFTTNPLECTETLEGGEPDTATLTCECTQDPAGLDRTDTDTSNFDCQEPDLEIEKECFEEDPATQTNGIHIVVTNPANPNGATLANCVVSDPLANFVSAPFGLAPGQSMQFDTFATLDAPALNTASVGCTIVGSGGQTIERFDDDPCDTVECDVRVDKQVSCDGGTTWDDAGYDDGVIDGCDTLTGQPVLVRYLAQNLSSRSSGLPADLVNCVLTDSNGVILAGPAAVGTIPEDFDGVIIEVDPRECNTTLEAGEPNTATLVCECFDDDTNHNVEDSDTANIECEEEADVDIEKECADQDMSGSNAVTITVCNPPNVAGASLEHCIVEDPLAGFTSAPFSLVPGECQNFNIFINGLMTDTLNTATVTCNVVGSDDMVSDQTEDMCSVTPCELEVVKTCKVEDVPDTGDDDDDTGDDDDDTGDDDDDTGDDDDDDAGDCVGKLLSIKLQYTGEGCAATNNPQSGKSGCTGGANFAQPVTVRVTDDRGDDVYGEMQLFLGDVIEATAANAGEDRFASQSDAAIRFGGNVIEDLTFHTSCSQPLNVGDQFGSLRVVEMTTTGGGTVSSLLSSSGGDLMGSIGDDDDDTGDDDDDTGESDHCVIPAVPPAPHCEGKVEVLTVRYNGGACAQSDNGQGPIGGKWNCSGDAGATEPVRLVCNKDNFSFDSGPANVLVGGLVDIASNTGTLPSEINCNVLNQFNNVVQQIRVHTSCSQPLDLGDKFGSLEVFGIDTTQNPPIAQAVEVTYSYQVTNISPDVPAVNINVFDDKLGVVPGSPIPMLAPGESVTLEATTLVGDDVVNTVVVVGQTQGGRECMADDTATVTFGDAPPEGDDDDDDGAAGCTSPIRGSVFRYTGPDVPGPVEVRLVARRFESQPVIYNLPGGLFAGMELTSPAENGQTIDATAHGQDSLGSKTTLYINNVPEVIHTSCSTPYVAGQPAPLDNPKGQPSALWFVVSFTQKN